MQRYDLVIAGASFAGLSCAQAAAAAGARVLVLERQPRAGHSVHTTGLLVKEAAERLGVPTALTRRIEGVRLYAPSLRHADLDAPGYYFLATDTAGVLRWLAQRAAAAGAELRFGCGFTDAFRGRRGWVLPNAGAVAAYVVGADGPRSAVARHFGLSQNREFLLGVEAQYRGLALGTDRLHCFLDGERAPGYLGWAFTGVDGVTQLGLACRRPFKPRLPELARHLHQVFDFRAARVEHLRGGLIPVGGRVPRWHGEGVVLVGDAAGVVSPLTAAGIHTAIDSGAATGAALADCLRRVVAFDPGQVAQAYPRFFWKRKLRALLDRRPPDLMLEMAVAHPLARRLAELVYFHRRGLGSAAGWRALLRLPSGRTAALEPPAGRLTR